MASSDHLVRLKAIRDNLESELSNETARRLALTVAGDPPPTNYSVGGKSFSWNDYVRTMLGLIKDANDLVIMAGGEDGGIPEVHVRTWS